ncbi:MAG: hypothetical protein ACPLW7_07025, partial [Minisyncoccia bacterium]
MNEQMDKWEIMWRDIFYTFFSWQILDDIIWMFKNNTNLRSMDLTSINHIHRLYIEAILMRLRKYLQPSNVSLKSSDINLPILLLEKVKENNKEKVKEINNLIHVICGFKEIEFKEIKGFKIGEFTKNVITTLCETHENIKNFISNIFDLETAKTFENEIDNFRKNVDDLKEKLKEVVKSLENLNKMDLNERLKEIDRLKQKVENIKKEYQEIIEKRIRLFNSIETHLYERVEKEHPEEVILPENLPENLPEGEKEAYYKASLEICLLNHYPDIKKKLAEIANNILTNLNIIDKCIELICLKLIFGKLWIICDKYIAHPSYESFDISTSISLEEIRNAVEKVIEKAY